MKVNRSAGNDIVSLRAIDRQRAHSAAFYSRILSGSEQTLYRSLSFPEMPFENFLWLLWSVKESVYKYCKRSVPGLVFSPAKIIVQQIGPSNADPSCRRPASSFEGAEWDSSNAGSGSAFYRGAVLFGSDIFYFRSVMYTELISSVVSGTEGFENIRWGFKRIDHSGSERQSAEVRTFLLGKLAPLFSGDLQQSPTDTLQFSGDPQPFGPLRIAKNLAGCPVVMKGDEEIDVPISLAHHGHFVGYSFLLTSPH